MRIPGWDASGFCVRLIQFIYTWRSKLDINISVLFESRAEYVSGHKHYKYKPRPKTGSKNRWDCENLRVSHKFNFSYQISSCLCKLDKVKSEFCGGLFLAIPKAEKLEWN